MRRPLWWLIPSLALGLAFGAMSLRDERRDEAFRDRSTVVTASVDGTWDGGSLVPVSYRAPVGGQERHAVVRWGPYLPDRDVDEVEIRVGEGTDPEVGPQPYGDHERWPTLMLFALPAIGGSALWLLLRRRRVARSRRLMAVPEPAYRMLAVPHSGRVFGRRWRLALHEVDARPGDPAVCVVPVVGQPIDGGPRPVEVKGRPRPGGEVVIREVDGRTWWPAGRAMVGARSTFGPDPSEKTTETALEDRVLPAERGEVPVGAWILLGVAVALFVVSMVVGDDPDAAEARSVASEAIVVVGRSSSGPVTVEHEWEGSRRTSQVVVDGAVEAGTTVAIRVDPEEPSRVWTDGQDVPERSDPSWSVFLFVVSVPLIVVAAFATRRSLDPLDRRVEDARDPDEP